MLMIALNIKIAFILVLIARKLEGERESRKKILCSKMKMLGKLTDYEKKIINLICIFMLFVLLKKELKGNISSNSNKNYHFLLIQKK